MSKKNGEKPISKVFAVLFDSCSKSTYTKLLPYLALALLRLQGLFKILYLLLPFPYNTTEHQFISKRLFFITALSDFPILAYLLQMNHMGIDFARAHPFFRVSLFCNCTAGRISPATVFLFLFHYFNMNLSQLLFRDLIRSEMCIRDSCKVLHRCQTLLLQ